jgi:hypothetical protein
MCAIYEKETGRTLERWIGKNLYGGDLGDQEGVREWVGLQHDDGSSKYEDSLTDLNDGGKTFEEIADFIESQPKGLLV